MTLRATICRKESSRFDSRSTTQAASRARSMASTSAGSNVRFPSTCRIGIPNLPPERAPKLYTCSLNGARVSNFEFTGRSTQVFGSSAEPKHFVREALASSLLGSCTHESERLAEAHLIRYPLSAGARADIQL